MQMNDQVHIDALGSPHSIKSPK